MVHLTWLSVFQERLQQAELKEVLTVKVLDQIVMANIKNPGLSLCCQMLMFDTVIDYGAGAERAYSYVNFRADAFTLHHGQGISDTRSSPHGSGVRGKVALAAVGSAGEFMKGCWRCGGSSET